MVIFGEFAKFPSTGGKQQANIPMLLANFPVIGKQSAVGHKSPCPASC
jgi:hypothetical protein